MTTEAEVRLFRKWYREIKKVGLKDWLWFVFYLKRDEFSPKLSLGVQYGNGRGGFTLSEIMSSLNKARQRAHEIDESLESVK